MLLVAVLLVPDAVSPTVEPEPAALRAAELVAFSAPNNPVVVSQIRVVVDASAVAVLPFVSSGDATLATGLERDVVASLRSVPGLYVIADNAVQPYAATELDAMEIRWVAWRARHRGCSRRSCRRTCPLNALICATPRPEQRSSSGGRPTSTDLFDELRAIRYEIAESVAATMLDSSLREQVVRADLFELAFVASKPFQQ